MKLPGRRVPSQSDIFTHPGMRAEGKELFSAILAAVNAVSA
ncbi:MULTISPECIES: hypothetical protein [unclassified Bradyrhizobium]